MFRKRNLTTATLLGSALAVSLVVTACSKSDRESAASTDTSRTYGGTVPSDTLTDTSAGRSVTPDTGPTATATPRRTRRSTSQRRMTAAERQRYEAGQWDTNRLATPITPTPQDTAKVEMPTEPAITAQPADTGITEKAPPFQRDTLLPDTVAPKPDTAKPDTTQRDTLQQRAYPGVTPPPDQPSDTTTPAIPQQQAPQQPPPQQPTDEPQLPEEPMPADVTVRADTAKPVISVAPAATTAPTDGQIVQFTLSVNAADSTAGALAASRGLSAQVRDFARMMVQDHGAANQRLTELMRRLNITPDSAFADYREFMEDTREQGRELAAKQGHEFDHAYMDHEVEMHEKALETLDRKLIPEADNAELKTLLQETRQSVQRHLEQARTIQSSLRR